MSQLNPPGLYSTAMDKVQYCTGQSTACKPLSSLIGVCVCVCARALVLVLVLLRCDSPEKLRVLLPRLEQDLKDSGKFKDFYQFTFNFAKNPGQKGLGEGEGLCSVLKYCRLEIKYKNCPLLTKIILALYTLVLLFHHRI